MPRSPTPAQHRLWHDLLAVALLGGGVLLLLALASFYPGDNTWFFTDSAELRNWCGIFGATLAYFLVSLFGFGALVLPIGMLCCGYFLMRRSWPEGIWLRSTGVIVGIAGILALFALGQEVVAGPPTLAGSGWLGELLAGGLRAFAGGWGGGILALCLILTGFLLASMIGLDQLFSRIALAVGKSWEWGKMRWAAHLEARRKIREQRDLVRKHQDRLEAEKATRQKTMPPGVLPDLSQITQPTPPVKKGRKAAAKPHPTAPGEQLPMEFEEPLNAEFQRPPSALLDPPSASSSVDIDLLKNQAVDIEKRFGEFKVAGKVVQWSPGPVVTTFEYQPDAGVALKSIITRSEDLCMALKATAVRIDRIPGKSTVGIEVPNLNREAIAFREIIESDAFTHHPSPLALALGKRMDGAPFVADLAQMPHLLIAGTTGSGKSVGLNSIITSLLFRCTPEECKLVLVDPKRVELGLFADVPHLLTPVVTEAKYAINALKWAVREMEERYKLLASCSVRNIMQFNKLVKEATKGGPGPNGGIMTDGNGAPPDSRLASPLPYIVVVIDEFADLMLVAPGDVETAVQRLAQMARAVGIHLVLATQRPSVDVISGLIKSNMQARIAFRVAQKIDSRVILDGSGAEKLLGMGDMLFLQPGTSQLLRLHGAYLSESEVAKVAKYLKRQGAPQYNETVLQDEKAPEAGGEGGLVPPEDVELFQRALELAIQEGALSATLFQNRLRLGQARARRIVDYLDQMNILGPVEAGKPRKVNSEKAMAVLNQSRSSGVLAGVPQSGETIDLDEPPTIDSRLD